MEDTTNNPRDSRDVFKNISPEMQNYLIIAQRFSKSQKHFYVGVEHFLAAFLSEQGSLIRRVIGGGKVNWKKKIQDLLIRAYNPAKKQQIWEGYLVTPRVQRIWEEAVERTRFKDSVDVKEAHILWVTLQDKEGFAYRWLISEDYAIDDILNAVKQELGSDGGVPAEKDDKKDDEAKKKAPEPAELKAEVRAAPEKPAPLTSKPISISDIFKIGSEEKPPASPETTQELTVKPAAPWKVQHDPPSQRQEMLQIGDRQMSIKELKDKNLSDKIIGEINTVCKRYGKFPSVLKIGPREVPFDELVEMHLDDEAFMEVLEIAKDELGVPPGPTGGDLLFGTVGRPVDVSLDGSDIFVKSGPAAPAPPGGFLTTQKKPVQISQLMSQEPAPAAPPPVSSRMGSQGADLELRKMLQGEDPAIDITHDMLDADFGNDFKWPGKKIEEAETREADPADFKTQEIGAELREFAMKTLRESAAPPAQDDAFPFLKQSDPFGIIGESADTGPMPAPESPAAQEGFPAVSPFGGRPESPDSLSRTLIMDEGASGQFSPFSAGDEGWPPIGSPFPDAVDTPAPFPAAAAEPVPAEPPQIADFQPQAVEPFQPALPWSVTEPSDSMPSQVPAPPWAESSLSDELPPLVMEGPSSLRYLGDAESPVPSPFEPQAPPQEPVNNTPPEGPSSLRYLDSAESIVPSPFEPQPPLEEVEAAVTPAVSDSAAESHPAPPFDHEPVIEILPLEGEQAIEIPHLMAEEPQPMAVQEEAGPSQEDYGRVAEEELPYMGPEPSPVEVKPDLIMAEQVPPPGPPAKHVIPEWLSGVKKRVTLKEFFALAEKEYGAAVQADEEGEGAEVLIEGEASVFQEKSRDDGSYAGRAVAESRPVEPQEKSPAESTASYESVKEFLRRADSLEGGRHYPGTLWEPQELEEISAALASPGKHCAVLCRSALKADEFLSHVQEISPRGNEAAHFVLDDQAFLDATGEAEKKMALLKDFAAGNGGPALLTLSLAAVRQANPQFMAGFFSALLASGMRCLVWGSQADYQEVAGVLHAEFALLEIKEVSVAQATAFLKASGEVIENDLKIKIEGQLVDHAAELVEKYLPESIYPDAVVDAFSKVHDFKKEEFLDLGLEEFEVITRKDFILVVSDMS
ncbi:MAG: Clp protease N-terminal domain-containing protein [Candidatus Eremiobacteraeota bacterium]|nr:Clp protease N-terminal domain-containing protein [Candidatus Eremiobacteraeota bacterium]